MTRTRQRSETAYQQGYADGRLGRPFRYHRPSRRRNGRLGRPYLYWYYNAYAAGYRNGRTRDQPRQIAWLWRHPWLMRGMAVVLGVSMTLAFIHL